MDRCAWVSKELDKKAHRVIMSEADIRELDYTLRTFCEAERRRRLWYRFRSDWFQGRDWLLAMEPLLWEPSLDQWHTKFNEEMFTFFDSTIRFIKAYRMERRWGN